MKSTLKKDKKALSRLILIIISIELQLIVIIISDKIRGNNKLEIKKYKIRIPGKSVYYIEIKKFENIFTCFS